MTCIGILTDEEPAGFAPVQLTPERRQIQN